MKLHFQDETNTLYQGDVLEVLATLPDASIDLVIEDPPYNGVKDDAWDNQWKKVEDYLNWLDAIAEQYQRILKPNGSLYRFASPQMAAQVEVAIAKRLRVINRITWRKAAGRHLQCEKEGLRGFFPASEAIVFCEQYGSDYDAACDELRGFVYEPIQNYLETERLTAGITYREINAAIGRPVAGGGMATHYFSHPSKVNRCTWQLPTKEHYTSIQQAFPGYFTRTYEELRQQYEELRQQYEELRRPFRVSASVPYTDVWDFPTVSDYPGKHPCEKPPSMLRHIISASSRPDAIVLDCFSGSGNASLEARDLGRKAIAIERDPKYCDRIARRLGQRTLFQFGALMEATA